MVFFQKIYILQGPKYHTSISYDCTASYRPPFWTHGHKRISVIQGPSNSGLTVIRPQYCVSGNKNNRVLSLSIENNKKGIYFVCTSFITEDEYKNSRFAMKAKKAIMIPPWVKIDKNSRNRGITLWSLGRYYKRSWDFCYKENIDVCEVFKVSTVHVKNKYMFKIKIKISNKEN